MNKKVSFYDFAKMIDKNIVIPAGMIEILEKITDNKRYCIDLHRHSGKRTILNLIKRGKCNENNN